MGRNLPTQAPASCWAIVVAGGSGVRFAGDVPKQYLPLGNQRVLDWSLQAMRHWVGNRLILVVPADRLQDAEPLAAVVVCVCRFAAQIQKFTAIWQQTNVFHNSKWVTKST